MKMIHRSSRSKAIIARLIKLLDPQAAVAPDHVGLMSYTAPDYPIDAGGYGNPHEDPPPDFLPQGDKKWPQNHT